MIDDHKLKYMAVLTLLQYEDGTPQAIITSHPDGNDLELLLKSIIELINVGIQAELKKDKLP